MFPVVTVSKTSSRIYTKLMCNYSSSQSEVRVTIDNVECLMLEYTNTRIVCDTGDYGSSIRADVVVSVDGKGGSVEVLKCLLNC